MLRAHAVITEASPIPKRGLAKSQPLLSEVIPSFEKLLSCHIVWGNEIRSWNARPWCLPSQIHVHVWQCICERFYQQRFSFRDDTRLTLSYLRLICQQRSVFRGPLANHRGFIIQMHNSCLPARYIFYTFEIKFRAQLLSGRMINYLIGNSARTWQGNCKQKLPKSPSDPFSLST